MCQPRPIFIRVGMLIQKPVVSRLVRKRPVALKKWPCPIFNEKDQNAKLKVSRQQAKKKKLTASVLMDSVVIATLCLKPRVASITFFPARSTSISH